MARIEFTPQLRRFTDTPTVETGAATLRAGLEAAFAVNPRLRGYVLDDQGICAPTSSSSSTAVAATGAWRSTIPWGLPAASMCCRHCPAADAPSPRSSRRNP